MRTKAIWAALAVLCAVTPASAEECHKPLTRILSLDLTPLGDTGIMLVPVSINGTRRQLLLNTGAARTTLNQATVNSLKLKPIQSGNYRLLDSAGHAYNSYVNLDSFQLGPVQFKNPAMMVVPGTGESYDGIMAGDMLDRFDIEMDFAGHKLNYFTTDHCPGQVISWQASAIAVVPFTENRPVRESEGVGMLDSAHDTHIRVPVTLDGKQFQAVIVTGNEKSTISAATAKYDFGITADSPGSTVEGMVNNDPSHKIIGHVFNTLTFGGITVTNPHISIFPDLVGTKDRANGLQTGSLIQHYDDGLAPEITIGMGVLKHLHLFVAFSEGKLYVTPANQPAPPAGASPP